MQSDVFGGNHNILVLQPPVSRALLLLLQVATCAHACDQEQGMLANDYASAA